MATIRRSRAIACWANAPPSLFHAEPVADAVYSAARRSELELEAVVGPLDAVGERQLVAAGGSRGGARARAARRRRPPRPPLRWPRGRPRLGSASVASQRKRSASRASSTSCVARRGVARVGKRRSPSVTRNPKRRARSAARARGHLEAGGLNGTPVLVLAHVEAASSMRPRSRSAPEGGERLAPAGRQPELRRLRAAARRRTARPEDPRHEVAPVVEVEMGHRDRVDERPRLPARAAARARPARSRAGAGRGPRRAIPIALRPGWARRASSRRP